MSPTAATPAFAAPTGLGLGRSQSLYPSLTTRPSLITPSNTQLRAALKPSTPTKPVPASLDDGSDKLLGPQGFTPFAEQLNGRVAQTFFIIGLATEIISGAPMTEQIGLLLHPLENGAQALEATAQICLRIIEGLAGSS